MVKLSPDVVIFAAVLKNLRLYEEESASKFHFYYFYGDPIRYRVYKPTIQVSNIDIYCM